MRCKARFGLRFLISFAIFLSGCMNIKESIHEENFYDYKKSIRTALPMNFQGKIFFHYLGWWGNGGQHGILTDYRSDDVGYIELMLNEVDALGGDGLAVAWFGFDDYSDYSLKILVNELKKKPNLKFFLVVDHAALKKRKCHDSESRTECFGRILSNIKNIYMTNSQYYTENGRHILYEFGIEDDEKIDWASLRDLTENVSLYRIHPSGFGKYGDGAFFWPQPSKYMQNILSTTVIESMQREVFLASKLNGKKSTFALYKGFDDSLAPWSQGNPKKIASDCGQRLIEQYRFFNSNEFKNYLNSDIQVVTWNDHDEGTGVEYGVPTCMHLSFYKLMSRQYLFVNNKIEGARVRMRPKFAQSSFEVEEIYDGLYSIECPFEGDVFLIAPPLMWDKRYSGRFC